MPPKKQEAGSKKTDQKKKEKVIEDKTFGLKNKKGAQTQKYIKNVTNQVKFGGNPAAKKLELERAAEKAKKDKKLAELEELNQLLKPVVGMNKVAPDVDPKSVLCVFYKQGLCTKGGKCKFSHDRDVERKTEKRSVYFDAREDGGGADGMAEWDEQQLNDVVAQKHGDSDKNKPKTAIICKYFLDAVESSKYGWFWECPNGETCIYRHCLPPGYVLNKDKKKADQDKQDSVTLEELVEKERAALNSATGTKVTYETFVKWKRRKVAQRKQALADVDKKKQADAKAGKLSGMSGRDLFVYNPTLADDSGDDEDGGEVYVSSAAREDDSDQEGEEVEAVEINEEMFGTYDDIDETEEMDNGEPHSSKVGAINEQLFDDDIDLSEDSAGEQHEGTINGHLAGGVEAVRLD